MNIAAPQVGDTITGTPGNWQPGGNAPREFVVQWLRDGLPIVGTRATIQPGDVTIYNVATADIGHHLSLQVAGQNGHGARAPIPSPASGTVLAGDTGGASVGPVVTKSANYTLAATDAGVVFTASATATMPDPATVADGRLFLVKAFGFGVTASASTGSSAVFDTAGVNAGSVSLSSVVVPSPAALFCVAPDGQNWLVVSGGEYITTTAPPPPSSGAPVIVTVPTIALA